MINTKAKSNLGEERVCFASYNSEVTAVTQGRNLEAEMGAEAMEEG